MEQIVYSSLFERINGFCGTYYQCLNEKNTLSGYPIIALIKIIDYIDARSSFTYYFLILFQINLAKLRYHYQSHTYIYNINLRELVNPSTKFTSHSEIRYEVPILAYSTITPKMVYLFIKLISVKNYGDTGRLSNSDVYLLSHKL